MKIRDIKRMTKEEFIAKAVKIHGNQFDYSEVVYVNNKIKITIFCNKHKISFEQKPNSHLRGSGCNSCKLGKLRKAKNSNIDEFITKAKNIHKNKYSYSNSTYINNSTKLEIECNCGHIFNQTPRDHLRGRGCPKCSMKNSINFHRDTIETFIEKAVKIHGNDYDYSLIKNYINHKTQVEIFCNKHKKSFKQRPTNHLKGQGCRECYIESKNSMVDYIHWMNMAETSKRFESYKLYLIRLFNKKENFYKIGITYLNLKERLRQIPYESEIIEIIEGGAEFIFNLEKEILDKNKSKQYVPKIKFRGKNECFSEKINIEV